MLSALLTSNAMAGTSKLIPARETLENIGFVTQWDAESKTAVFKSDDYNVSVTAGSEYFEVNGQKATFDDDTVMSDYLMTNLAKLKEIYLEAEAN